MRVRCCKFTRGVVGVALLLLTLSMAGPVGAQTLNEEGKKELPNIITPNGDGVNDELKLESSQELVLMIFNRMGNEVFRVAAKQITWDGTNAYGRALPDGIYYYTLSDPAGEFAVNRGFLYISRSTMK